MREKAWDKYSRRWEEEHGESFALLGHEWGGPEFARHVVETWVRPYVAREAVLAEIGPGGGRMTEFLVPLCKELHLADISGEMLRRLQETFGHLSSVHYHKLDGESMTTVPECDAVFSWDVFVHLEPEHIYMYLTEIRKRLRPRGVAIIHFSNILTEQGWRKFVGDYDLSIGGKRDEYKFSWMTPQIMRQFLDSLGFEIEVLGDLDRDAITVFRKPTAQTADASGAVDAGAMRLQRQLAVAETRLSTVEARARALETEMRAIAARRLYRLGEWLALRLRGRRR
jgi:SAM-dependent methyltransferase